MMPDTRKEITVLIVDDDENNLQLSAKAVYSAGYQVIMAQDGMSALEITDSIIPDAILLDIMMPGIDGLEVCKRMKGNPALSDIPVIFLSAAGEEEKIEFGLAHGGVDFVAKPVSNRVLLARLRTHIERGILQRSLHEKNQELETRNALLAEREAYLQAVIEGSPVPQFVLNRNHQVLSWNRAMEDYSGIAKSDIIGTDHHWSVFYPYPRPCLSDLILDGTIEPDTYYEGKIKRSPFLDGAYQVVDYVPGKKTKGAWIFFTASPVIDAQGQIIGAVETLIDLSDQKHAEESLKEVVQKLYLLSEITRHDILNKITALVGCVALIGEQIPESEPRDYVNRTKDVIEVIRTQIAFTRDYQEIGIHSPEWQNMSEIISRTSDSLDMGTVSIDHHLQGLELFADPLLERVFYNLFENSLRHGTDITTIRLSAKIQEDSLIVAYEDD
ncbi:MAG TPA: response regulator, partial [Methanospirillum sp.]|nr:response regulator [Methanospirillum sp.]